jgi:uncharacterized membrane protein
MSQKISILSSAILVVIMAFLAVDADFLIPQPDKMTGQDIYFSFVEGQRVQHGENPYARILGSDMRNNNKYATYFPVFYELSLLSQNLGLDTFPAWMDFWRVIFIAFELATAALLYLAFYRRRLEWLGVLACGFWLFNRWTLQVVQTENMDFIPIFFLLLSLELFPRKMNLSLFFFSLSLGFKQIAIFLLPLYLIWIYRSAGKAWLAQLLKATLVIASVPLVAALPFLVWSPEGFIKSVFFSATRLSGNTFGPFSLDVLLGWSGLPARIAMLVCLLAVYAIAWKGYGGKYLLSFFAMLVFLGFNASLFSQYQAWTFVLVPLIFCDFYDLAGPAGGSTPQMLSSTPRDPEPSRHAGDPPVMELQ